jgi:hypothetical protein
MRKLRLDPDLLAVDSFDVSASASAAPNDFAATPLCLNTLPVDECLTRDTFQNC